MWKGNFSDGDNKHATDFLVACKIIKVSPPADAIRTTPVCQMGDTPTFCRGVCLCAAKPSPA